MTSGFGFLHAAYCTGMLNSSQRRKCGIPRSLAKVASRSLFHHTCPIKQLKNSSKLTTRQYKKAAAASEQQRRKNVSGTNGASSRINNNNNNTIWRGSVLIGEEPPPHSGELNHALSQVGGTTQSQLSRPMSSGHHISMEHRPRRKQLNSDTNASNQKYLKEIQEKKNFFFGKNEKHQKIKK